MSGPTEWMERIRGSIIGRDQVVRGPFGPRRVTYADYTAPGRSLAFIGNFIRDAVLPLYASTHTESSGTGLQTTRFREGAREIVREDPLDEARRLLRDAAREPLAGVAPGG